CWLPLTKLLPRALTLKKWIGTANLVLLIVTQFTFVTNKVVVGPLSAARLRESREREAQSVRRRLAEEAAQRAVENMSDGDKRELKTFAVALTANDMRLYLKPEELVMTHIGETHQDTPDLSIDTETKD